jgi:hypothetical protein
MCRERDSQPQNMSKLYVTSPPATTHRIEVRHAEVNAVMCVVMFSLSAAKQVRTPSSLLESMYYNLMFLNQTKIM